MTLRRSFRKIKINTKEQFGGIASIACLVASLVCFNFLITVESWAIVSYPPVTACEQYPLGKLGLYTATFDPSCVANSDAPTAALFQSRSSFQGTISAFWPLFVVQSGFNGFVSTPFVSCNQSFDPESEIQQTILEYARVTMEISFGDVDRFLAPTYDEYATKVSSSLATLDSSLAFWPKIKDTALDSLFVESLKSAVQDIANAHLVIEGIISAASEKALFFGGGPLSYNSFGGNIRTSSWSSVQSSLRSNGVLLATGNTNMFQLLPNFDVTCAATVCDSSSDLRDQVNCSGDVNCCVDVVQKAYNVVLKFNSVLRSYCGYLADYDSCLLDGILQLDNLDVAPKLYKSKALDTFPMWLRSLVLVTSDQEMKESLQFAIDVISECIQAGFSFSSPCDSLYARLPVDMKTAPWGLSKFLPALNQVSGGQIAFVGTETAWEVVLTLQKLITAFPEQVSLSEDEKKDLPLLLGVMQTQCLNRDLVSISACSSEIIGTSSGQNAIPDILTSNFKLCNGLVLQYNITQPQCTSFVDFVRIVSDKTVKTESCVIDSNCTSDNAMCQSQVCSSKLEPFRQVVDACLEASQESKLNCREYAAKTIATREILETFLGPYNSTSELIARCENDGTVLHRMKTAQVVLPLAMFLFVVGIGAAILFVVHPHRNSAYASSVASAIGVLFLGVSVGSFTGLVLDLSSRRVEYQPYYEVGSAASLVSTCIILGISSAAFMMVSGWTMKPRLLKKSSISSFASSPRL